MAFRLSLMGAAEQNQPVERAAVMFRSQRLHRRMFHEARPDGIVPEALFPRRGCPARGRERVAAGIVPERVQDDPLRVGQGNEAARSADGVIQLFHDAFGHRHKIRVPIEQLFQRGGAEGHFGGVVRPDPLKAARFHERRIRGRTADSSTGSCLWKRSHCSRTLLFRSICSSMFLSAQSVFTYVYYKSYSMNMSTNTCPHFAHRAHSLDGEAKIREHRGYSEPPTVSE